MRAFVVSLAWANNRGAVALVNAETEYHATATLTSLVMQQEGITAPLTSVMVKEVTGEELRFVLRAIEGERGTVISLIDKTPEGAA